MKPTEKLSDAIISMRHSKTPARKPNRQKESNILFKDPVEVYCCIRPMEFLTSTSYLRASSTKIVITPPESAINFRTVNKEIREYTFSSVFTSDVTQKEIFKTVALPLVENLIQGRNGLLFTYGVTGSGKTYTMTGELQDSGIMSRCLDVIFNTISNHQTKKFVFKPDKFNGFDIQSEIDAMFCRQQEIHAGLTQKSGKFMKYRKVDSSGDSSAMVALERSECNESQIVNIDLYNAYSVFVTYVEIYKNNVYDLLDDDIRSKQNKIIREDGNKNVYVFGVIEVEVKSVEEALEVFQRGQRQRRVAQTALNTESSRSHSIYTIRLVQAPLDCEGGHVIQDKRLVCINQLSLVDLAGSERTNRTKNTGDRLREAGNINNSLMNLRLCMEILRENQSQGTNKMVPYRDSKLTLLFKNYFDGEGQVKMIVCINPRVDDYDETIQVMNFAEMTQEVQTTRPTAPKLELGLTPGRRQANKEAKNKFEEKDRAESADSVYILNKSFPPLEITTPDNDQIIHSLIQFLKQCNNKRNIHCADLLRKQNNFRKMVVAVEQENMNLTVEAITLKATNSQQKKKIKVLEGQLCKTEKQVDNLLCKLNNASDMIRSLQQEIKKRDLALNRGLIDNQKIKQKYNNKMQVETDKMNKELEIKLRQQRERFQNQMKEKEDRIRLMKQILMDDNVDPAMTMLQKEHIPEPTAKVFSDTETRTSRKDNIPVSNPRYRRSRSVESWIDHRLKALVPLDTVL